MHNVLISQAICRAAWSGDKQFMSLSDLLKLFECFDRSYIFELILLNLLTNFPAGDTRWREFLAAGLFTLSKFLGLTTLLVVFFWAFGFLELLIGFDCSLSLRSLSRSRLPFRGFWWERVNSLNCVVGLEFLAAAICLGLEAGFIRSSVFLGLLTG